MLGRCLGLSIFLLFKTENLVYDSKRPIRNVWRNRVSDPWRRAAFGIEHMNSWPFAFIGIFSVDGNLRNRFFENGIPEVHLANLILFLGFFPCQRTFQLLLTFLRFRPLKSSLVHKLFFVFPEKA